MEKGKPESNKEEFIVCAAINLGINNIVCGFRHLDCVNTIKSLCQEIGWVDKLIDNAERGFLTSKNRFVSRKEAFTIAKKQNQIWHKLHDGVDENILVSEDLY